MRVNTGAKVCFANTSERNTKKSSKQAKQSEIKKGLKIHFEKNNM